MRRRVRRRPAGPDQVQVDRLAAGELQALGQRALDAVGARLALLFVATALPGITLAAQPGEGGRPVAAAQAIVACGVGVALVLARRLATPWVLTLAVAGTVAMVAPARPAPHRRGGNLPAVVAQREQTGEQRVPFCPRHEPVGHAAGANGPFDTSYGL